MTSGRVPGSVTGSVISARGLQVHFGAVGRAAPLRAVDGVDFDVGPGEFHGIVGESGCGKTTLARTLVGLQTPTAGSIRIDGRDLREWTDAGRAARLAYARKVQFVFQDPLASLSRRQSIFQTLEEPLRIHAMGSAAWRKARVFDLLEQVKLPPSSADRLPRELSGGQRQRVAIARALALEPTLLVCDEPLSALDVSIRAGLLNLFAELRQRLRLAIVLIAHDLAIVRLVCSRVSVMYLGRVVETGDVAEVFAHPRHPYTRALLAAVPSTDPSVAAHRSGNLMHGEPPSPSRPPSGCRFHPRCPLMQQRCAVESPLLRATGMASSAACHLV